MGIYNYYCTSLYIMTRTQLVCVFDKYIFRICAYSIFVMHNGCYSYALNNTYLLLLLDLYFIKKHYNQCGSYRHGNTHTIAPALLRMWM